MATKKKAKKKAAKKTAPKKRAAESVPKGPRQSALPGMEDRGIQALDDLALSYAEVRDRRIALQTGPGGEGELKNQLMGMMHAKKKTSYTHGNVHIEIVPEGKKIKVKILSEWEQAEAAEEEEAEAKVNAEETAEELADETEEKGEEEIDTGTDGEGHNEMDEEEEEEDFS
jgi:hypothetical protein